jgi:tetratricopeptide (TPR) repeat protein
MRFRTFCALVLPALFVASAATAADFTVNQANYPDPQDATQAVEDRNTADSTEIALLKDAYEHVKAARIARLSGRDDDARAEDKLSADYLVSFVDKYTTHRNRLVFLRMAVERYLNAREWLKAAETAQRLLNDKDAEPVTKAIASRYGAGAWQMVAVTDMKSGKIPPLKLVPSGARKGEAAKPRMVDLPWKMFVEDADAYAKYRQADPSAKLSAEEQKAAGGADAAQLEAIAAQVEFGYDNMEDAQGRFGKLIANYPSRPDLMESAVPLYLDTFQFTKDRPALEAAIAKVEPLMAAEAKRSAAEAAAPGASEQVKKDAAIYARLATQLKDAAGGGDYATAAELMSKGDAAARDGKAADATARYKEAAALFEKFAASSKDSPDAPNALFNAALALDKAKDGKGAAATRERLLAIYPDAKMTGPTYVLLGQGLWNEGNYAGSAAAYDKYLEKFPDGPQRCLALQNGGYALQKAGKKADAVQRFQRFASDPTCTKDDPNMAARVLYETGKSLAEQKKTAEAKKVFQQLVALQGVTGVVEKSYQTDAAQRIKTLK